MILLPRRGVEGAHRIMVTESWTLVAVEVPKPGVLGLLGPGGRDGSRGLGHPTDHGLCLCSNALPACERSAAEIRLDEVHDEVRDKVEL